MAQVEIDGPERSAYSHPIKLRLLVPSEFPAAAPAVRFASIIHHFMSQKHSPHEMLEQYIDAVAAAEAEGEHTLAATVEAVMTFLSTPLHPCDHCDANYKATAQQNHEVCPPSHPPDPYDRSNF